MLLEEVMLIINPIKEGSIVSLKLTNSEELIGKLTSKNDKETVINRPVVLTATRDGMTMVPFMMTADPGTHDYTFKNEHVMNCVPTNKSLAGQYIEGTTGIKLA